MSGGGLLAGFLGGAAEGVGEVSTMGLKERAQARRDAAQRKHETNKAKIAAAGKGKKDKGFTIKTEKYLDENEEEQSKLVKVYDTGVKEDLYNKAEYDKYKQGVLNANKKFKYSGLDIEQKYKNRQLPTGLSQFIIDNPNL